MLFKIRILFGVYQNSAGRILHVKDTQTYKHRFHRNRYSRFCGKLLKFNRKTREIRPV